MYFNLANIPLFLSRGDTTKSGFLCNGVMEWFVWLMIVFACTTMTHLQ